MKTTFDRQIIIRYSQEIGDAESDSGVRIFKGSSLFACAVKIWPKC